MDYLAVEETIKADYRAVTPQYRRDDEIEVTTENHRHISRRLRELCESFPHAICALDVGCGTGRYFHCLTNVRELTGLDITEEMLRAAENPVRQEQVSIPVIRLVRANVYLKEFPAESFHFIYSLGMFGNGCPVTTALCDKFHTWLVPGGKLYFNAVDTTGLPLWFRTRRQIRGMLWPLLPERLRQGLREREARHPFYGLTQRELANIMKSSRFSHFEVASRPCASPLWEGRHLECVATKAP
ncbi:MAG TPA: class I SAM-dependent methyltransferase [Verrucomicrobia bacterium]|nr:class I SAM-dependent methyltransferase [Verrucomicrobiota bacterium]HOP98930.1 methyltransferase domain-containing protein [Verrucomicrobiota bacterium]